jgi:nitrogen fixation NifU-like protein
MSAPANELEEMYREAIADHAKRPRNFRKMSDADYQAEGHNPVCGDKLTVWVRVSDGVIADISFEGSGCSIGTASASMMTEAMKGKTLEEARRLFERFRQMLTCLTPMANDSARNMGVSPMLAPPARAGSTCHDANPPDELGKLAALAGVKRFPIRVKCATLPWHTLRAALERSSAQVSTELPV